MAGQFLFLISLFFKIKNDKFRTMNDILKKINKFNKRWEIIDDSTYEQEFKKFKNRVLNIFLDIDDHVLDEGISLFCQLLGIPEKWKHSFVGRRKGTTVIIDSLRQENDDNKFYRLLQIIFYLPIQTSVDDYYMNEITYSKDILYRKLAEAIKFSKVNLAITKKDEEIILFPRGEEKLDQKLVEGVLSFLNDKSNKHFIDALNSYEKGTKKDRVKSAESLRRSLEEFLRFKLKNRKGLKKNIKELQKRLKADGRDPYIRGIIFRTFSYLDTYFNENSKHKNGDINEEENEFLVYQTGLLMRYIEKGLA